MSCDFFQAIRYRNDNSRAAGKAPFLFGATVALLALVTSLFSAEVLAEEGFNINPLITYNCDQPADILVITNSLLRPEEAKTYNFDDANGTYNPWDMVKIDPERKKMSPLYDKKIVKNCQLSSGTYTVTIEPKLFSRELDSACGTSISGAITIDLEGIEIMEKKAFEDFCHGNAPIITRITVFGKTQDIKIVRIPKYKFY